MLPFKEKGGDRQYVNIYTDIRHPVTGRWKREKIQLAEAVLRATQGPPKSSNLQCSHLDGDATNCAPDNLAWETRTTNIQRQLHANNFNRGANNPNAKLSHAQREEVIRMGRERYTATAIAHTFRVSVSTVSRILKKAGITTRGWRTI
ncbi:hypothetical protein GCM10007856_28140 [Azospirillum oryzae]|nr:hypothetical protein GCM10007856_28140 [Azospirillum oryzae]